MKNKSTNKDLKPVHIIFTAIFGLLVISAFHIVLDKVMAYFNIEVLGGGRHKFFIRHSYMS